MHFPDSGRATRPSTPGPLRVCVVGAGALGSEIVRQFATGRSPLPILHAVTLIDGDLLEARNIPASRLFAEAQRRHTHLCGRPKVQIVAAEAACFAPHVRWTPVSTQLEQVGWQDLQKHDILLTATDNLPSRLYAAHACRLLGLPMLDAGVHGSGTATGRAAIFPAAPEVACYACTLTAATRAAALCALRQDSQGCATLPQFAPMDSSFQTSTALVRTAEAACRLLAEFASEGPTVASAVHVHDHDTVTLALTRSDDCPWHTRGQPLRRLAPAIPLCHQLAEDEVFLLPAPLYRGAVCGRCGGRSQRTALAVRWSSLPCDRCGATETWTPIQTVSTIGPTDPVARATPDELLLPPRHLLPVRRRIQRHWTNDTP